MAKTVKEALAELEALLANAIEEDTNDAEALTDVDNSYNEGWQKGLGHAIESFKEAV
jgi:hypothetical protein